MPQSPKTSKLRQEALRSARRVYVDGETWLVYELPPLAFDRRSTSSLVFESEGTVRRVRNYPPNWRDLSDAELFDVSWSA
jgi:hypothetical protein